MRKQTRWMKRHIHCPEAKCDTSILIEWRREKGKDELNSIICNHPQLENYHGWDCKWCCWEKIAGEKKI